MLRSDASGAARGKAALSIIAVLSLTVVACDQSSPTSVGDDPKGPVTEQLIVQPAEVRLSPNDSIEFRAIGLSASGDTTAVQVSWSTTDGTVRGKGEGNAWGIYKGNQKGAHEVVATDTSGVADTAVVTVLEAPTADFTFSAADLAVVFTDASTDGDGTITGWSWDFGDGGTSTEPSPSHTYAAAGSFDVILTVTDNDGLTGSVTKSLSVSPSVTSQVVKLAFIGDQGWESPSGEPDGPRAVLQLIEDEGAHAVVHQGDFDYRDDPAAWVQQIDDVLGPDFPYFVSVGNHDVAMWDGAGGYKERMEQRATRLGFTWTGELGESSELHFRGIHLLFGAPGTLDAPEGFYADYFGNELAADTSTWRVCSWHKNQRLMQVGGKGNSTGWGVYEACRAGGAIIATGHEHSYSRTHLLSSMEHQTIASTLDTLRITEGETFAFVSGLGGISVRDQELSGDWWASIYTSTQGATYGALFGVFNIEGRDDLAYFYFKDIDGNVVDAFWVVSAVK